MDILKYTFFQNALIAAILTSILCGIIGPIISEKKLVMMSGGIAHSSFGGIGLGYFLNIEPIITGLLFSIIASISIMKIKEHSKANTDTIIGILWAIGMALGILFISLTPGYPPDMTSYLFGDILTVSFWDLVLMLVLDIVIVLLVSGLYYYWTAYLFDDEFLRTMNIKTSFFDYVLYILIACTIVALIKIVGIILVIALLTIPTAIAKECSRNFKQMMVIAIGISAVFCLTGLYLSYIFNIPSGASIILLSGLIFLMNYILKVVLS